jgi:hypothetical protein
MQPEGRGSTRQRLLYALTEHHLVGTRKPKRPRGGLSGLLRIHDFLELGKELGSILDFVDDEMAGVGVEEEGRVGLGESPVL